ncbi:MAG: lamin tail domain-containing protein [Flavobacteriales bacterium]
MDDFFQREDWIEIYNNGGITNLGGYYLSDDPTNLMKWQIPTTDPGTTTILPNNHLIFWIDKDPEQGADHVDFSLSADGESVILTSPDGVTIIDQVDFSQMASDISYGRVCDGCAEFQYFNHVTFDAPNSEIVPSTQLMFINEVQVNNTSTWKDLSNEYEPWIEIFNPNTSQVNLAGYSLTLNGSETFTFPSNEPYRTVILPGEFKLYWCDGEPLEGANHTNFILTQTGTIELRGPDNAISDSYTYSATGENESYGRQTDGATNSIVFVTPTPEVTNSLVIVPSPTLYINELLAVNHNDVLDNADQLEDWIEIYNPNAFPVNIGGYYLSDNPENPRKWQIPSFTQTA